MTELFSREEAASKLSREATEFLIDKLESTKGTGFRGTTDLENDIYCWILSHGIFHGERE